MLAKLDGISYTLMECGACGLVYQREAPDDDLVEALYERWIDPEDSLARMRAHDLGLYAGYAQEIMQAFHALARPPASLKVLDFGMGWGRWPALARGFGAQVFGSEISDVRLAHARSVGIESVAWNDLPGQSFDLINTEQVFEHLVEPRETLAQLARALAPDGLLKISVPNGTNIHRLLRTMDWGAPKFTRNSLNAVAPLEHLNCYDAGALRALGATAGLQPVYLPLSTYYRFTFPSTRLRRFARELVKPVYRSVLRRGSYMYFRHV